MLDRKCRKIVKCCAKYYPKHDIIQTEDLQKHIDMSRAEIFYCCKRLNELGYFELFQTSFESTVHFIPGYKIFNYKEYTRTQLKEFLFRSILVPIIVSVIASILVTLITLMISGIQQ